MPFLPEDVARKQFLVRARGYDRDEVAAFLRAVAADYERALSTSSAVQAAPPPSAAEERPAQVDHGKANTERRVADLLASAERRLEEIADRERVVAEAEQRLAAQVRAVRELMHDARRNIRVALSA